MKKTIAFIVVVGLMVLANELFAQCPMCKTSLEEARKNGSQVGSGLNNGILYLLALPYTIALVFGLLYWRNHRLKKTQ